MDGRSHEASQNILIGLPCWQAPPVVKHALPELALAAFFERVARNLPSRITLFFQFLLDVIDRVGAPRRCKLKCISSVVPKASPSRCLDPPGPNGASRSPVGYVVFNASIRRLGIRFGKVFAISCLRAAFPARWAALTVQKKTGEHPKWLALPAR